MMDFARLSGLIQPKKNSNDGDDPPNPSKRARVQKTTRTVMNAVRQAPLWPVLFATLVGYRVGVRFTTDSFQKAATSTTTAVVQRSRQTVLLSLVLVAMVVREVWRGIPAWIKRQVPLLGRKARARAAEEATDPHDMTSLANIVTKLQSLSDKAAQKLTSPLQGGALQATFLALLQLGDQLKQQQPDFRDGRYKQHGTPVTDPSDVFKGLDEAFEFADWAYNEWPDEDDNENDKPTSLKQALQALDFTLLRHDANVLPGSVAHYIAISKTRKLCVVGVKGTSSFEDLLTDCCGQAITHKLRGPFVTGGASEIQCHEGVIRAAARLADDVETLVEELFLPNGYKVLLTGHSLGAGVASLVGVILRSRFPDLLKDDGTLLKTLAFASPPVLDYDAALACSSFTTTIVNNSDMIPRCSLCNLAVILEFLKSLHTKMETKGVSPKDFDTTKSFLKMLTAAGKGEPIMTVDEVGAAMENAFKVVELRDPDHLYVPGRVIHMYDLWSKECYGEVSETVDEKVEQADGTESAQAVVEKAVEEVRTAEKAYISNGASDLLRYIEMEARMVTDHLSPSYRSSIKALLSTPVSAV
jgi:pimeloyl-ACP methyl ester carboxylesterase